MTKKNPTISDIEESHNLFNDEGSTNFEDDKNDGNREEPKICKCCGQIIKK